MRFPLGFAAAAILVTCSGCGGGGDGYGGNPGAPSPPPTTNTPVIAIVGDRGAASFAPNPGSGSQEQTIVWRNNDLVTHRIVANDGTFDSGDIAAGANSRVVQIPSAGTNYHCSIHPGMIGSLAASSGAPPPPCTGIYC
jgi:plastocyanin